MTVRFFPVPKAASSRRIAGFLDEHHVDHQLVAAEDVSSSAAWYRLGELSAVEVDGRLFVDPNEDALRKIFHVN